MTDKFNVKTKKGLITVFITDNNITLHSDKVNMSAYKERFKDSFTFIIGALKSGVYNEKDALRQIEDSLTSWGDNVPQISTKGMNDDWESYMHKTGKYKKKRR
jgi:hypothetical protein